MFRKLNKPQIRYGSVVTVASGYMPVLKVKVDFKNPRSGSIHESPKISILRC